MAILPLNSTTLMVCLCLDMRSDSSIITGSIVFTVAESPLKARAVLISVQGQGRTHWTVSERHTNTQSQTTHRTVTYSATCPYAEGEAIVWTPSQGGSSGLIDVGIHKFPFKFLLPGNCAPSFEGTHGYIRYFCKAKIDRPWKFDHTTKQVFTVVPTFDLNLLPNASLPVQSTQSKDTGFFFFKSGNIKLTARLHKGGFVPGESISLHTHIHNHSSKSINKIDVKLVEVSRYTAYRNGQTVTEGCIVSRSSQQRVHKRNVTQIEERLDIEKGSDLDLPLLIPIPPVAPTFNLCSIITVEYYLKIKATTSGAIGSKVSTEIPVLIGTIPIRYHAPIQQSPSPWQTPYPDLPQGMPTPDSSLPINDFGDAPPSYEECVFGAGTIKDEDDNKGFAPRYVFYPNINPSAPPLDK
ncbi:hypothetical protein PENTCL1PPCAC_11345 [Pristionchus entomophagus]|uniref:Arrestin C-terminal-like domain-containing protein n=1 Tax=Pristionchus entomophagus TaxID=358040 RepID=A0AAV5T269_9BILA|nr:hypothetical protein PENTCL1PPCAC_11345 [Pristionchus entomophagus]